MRAAVVLASALACLGAGASRQSESELAPGEDRELVEMVCTTCHTAQNIVASHMSRESWHTTLTWMEETQGLAELEPEIRERILDYLEATQGLDDAEVDPADSPWAHPLYRPNPLWETK